MPKVFLVPFSVTGEKAGVCLPAFLLSAATRYRLRKFSNCKGLAVRTYMEI